MKKSVNGLELEQVQGMVDAVKKQPEMARAKFFATTKWGKGFENTALIKDFSLGGATNKTSRSASFKVVGDHPPELLGTNKGPSSVEIVLAALGHCIASGWATYGAVMNLPIERLEVEVEGDVDLQGMLALPEPGAVRPGFSEIRAKYLVKTSAPRNEVEKLRKMAEDLSPTKDSLRAVPFSSSLVLSR